MKQIVFDSFAMLALFRGELGAEEVRQLLVELERDRSLTGHMSSINLGEVYYMIIRKGHSEHFAVTVISDIKRFPIRIVAPNTLACLDAAILKSRYSFSYADAFGAALALSLRATFVTGDPEFKPLEKNEGLLVHYISK